MIHRAKHVVSKTHNLAVSARKSIIVSITMGNCASNVTCTATDQPIDSDPDIAGIGVLVSFGATAVITFIAIVVGYLTDSLPDSTLTQLDRACKYSTFISSFV